MFYRFVLVLVWLFWLRLFPYGFAFWCFLCFRVCARFVSSVWVFGVLFFVLPVLLFVLCFGFGCACFWFGDFVLPVVCVFVGLCDT